MWITKKIAATAAPKVVERGETSIGGEEAAVALRGEQRGIEVMAPGGYIWRPKRGDDVLVIKDSVRGESVIAAAKMGAGPEEMKDGEVCISVGSTKIYLTNTGKIKMYGDIVLFGSLTYGEEEEEEGNGEGNGEGKGEGEGEGESEEGEADGA